MRALPAFRRTVTRRGFLTGGARAAGGALLGFGVLRAGRAALASPPAPAPKGMKTRVLGSRTGLVVSEIGFGGYPVRDPVVLDRAIDLGITYVDTSDDYRDGDSERVIGEVMARRRKDVVLATKIHPWSRHTKAEILAMLEASLKRLRCDHVDVLQVHQVGRASGAGDGNGGGDPYDRLSNPALHEAFALARRQGKARFLGATGHDGDLMEVMHRAVDSGRFDVILCRYNLLDYPEQQALFARAAKAGVGVTVMKTLAGARKADLAALERGGASFAQAALRWVLDHPHVGCALISIGSIAQAEEYAGASGRPLSRADLELLERWEARHGREWCRMCQACESACPAGLKVADLLRGRLYAESHGDPGRGRAVWQAAAAAGGDPAACAGCPAPCLPACAWGVPVKQRLLGAPRLLA